MSIKLHSTKAVDVSAAEKFLGAIEEEEVEERGLIELWKNRQLKINLICSCMVWLHGSFNFYMLTFYLKYFPGNIFVNAMSFAAADLIAYSCSGIVLKLFSIR